MLIEAIGVFVGVISVGWAIWSYRKYIMPTVRITCDAAVFFSGKDMFFTPKGSTKRTPIKPGALQQPCLSIHAHNLGPTTVAIEKVAVSLKHKRKTILLEGCWLAVQDKERVPCVLTPGGTWEGLCDYFWLQDQLIREFGNHSVWELKVRLWDAATGRAYKSAVVLSDDIFDMVRRRYAIERLGSSG